MIEALRVLKACRKTAVAARRVALQMIHSIVVCAPDDLRDQLHKLTRMELIRTLADWRSDKTDYRNVASAYRITLRPLARRYLELYDEIADLDRMISAIVDDLVPKLLAWNSIGHESAAQLLLDQGPRRKAYRRGALQTQGHSLLQALHRKQGLLPHQPTPPRGQSVPYRRFTNRRASVLSRRDKRLYRRVRIKHVLSNSA